MFMKVSVGGRCVAGSRSRLSGTPHACKDTSLVLAPSHEQQTHVSCESSRRTDSQDSALWKPAYVRQKTYVKRGAGQSLAGSRSATHTHAKRHRSRSLLQTLSRPPHVQAQSPTLRPDDTCTAQLFQYYAVARRTVAPPLLQPPKEWVVVY